MYVKALPKGLSWGSQGSNPGLWHTQSLSYCYLVLILLALGTDFFIFYFQQTGAKKHSRFTHMVLVILLISLHFVLSCLLTILFFHLVWSCWPTPVTCLQGFATCELVNHRILTQVLFLYIILQVSLSSDLTPVMYLTMVTCIHSKFSVNRSATQK